MNTRTGPRLKATPPATSSLLTISCNETEEEYIPQLLVYNSAGTLVRTTDIALPDGFGPQEEMRLTLSADGSVYVYIPVVDVVVYRFSGVVAKVDSSGTVAWTYLYVPPSNFYASLPGFGVYDPVGAASDTKVYVSGAYSPDYSMNEATVILIGEEDETLVDLTSFTAEADDDVAVIRWETAAEPDNAGFHLLRSRAENGTYVRITDSLIAAEGDGFTRRGVRIHRRRTRRRHVLLQAGSDRPDRRVRVLRTGRRDDRVGRPVVRLRELGSRPIRLPTP